MYCALSLSAGEGRQCSAEATAQVQGTASGAYIVLRGCWNTCALMVEENDGDMRVSEATP